MNHIKMLLANLRVSIMKESMVDLVGSGKEDLLLSFVKLQILALKDMNKNKNCDIDKSLIRKDLDDLILAELLIIEISKEEDIEKEYYHEEF